MNTSEPTRWACDLFGLAVATSINYAAEMSPGQIADLYLTGVSMKMMLKKTKEEDVKEMCPRFDYYKKQLEIIFAVILNYTYSALQIVDASWREKFPRVSAEPAHMDVSTNEHPWKNEMKLSAPASGWDSE